ARRNRVEGGDQPAAIHVGEALEDEHDAVGAGCRGSGGRGLSGRPSRRLGERVPGDRQRDDGREQRQRDAAHEASVSGRTLLRPDERVLLHGLEGSRRSVATTTPWLSNAHPVIYFLYRSSPT